MSFGFPSAPSCTNPSTLCTAVRYANERSVLMVASSGNRPPANPADVEYPASDTRVIAVGGIVPGGAFWGTCDPALDTADCPSFFGPSQELVAPARQVLSTFYPGMTYAGTGCDDTAGFGGLGYGPCTGTSMSSPHIAGLGTLVRSVNPLLRQEDVRDVLKKHASQNGVHSPTLGYGFPNAAASVDSALGTVAGAVLTNRLTPLFSLYSSVAEDFLYTTVPQMAVAAQLDTVGYAVAGPLVPGYPAFPYVCAASPCLVMAPRASLYLFTTAKAPPGRPNLVPLFRLTFRGTNPLNGNTLNRDTTYTTEAPGVRAFGSVGYQLDGIEGYLHPRCTPEPSCIPPGAVRLYRRYHTQRDDFAIFPESELAAMNALGYTSNGGGNEILGYVYPNLDSDGDFLIDGFERLVGTNLAGVDSDGDGQRDGAELLTYPYRDPLRLP